MTFGRRVIELQTGFEVALSGGRYVAWAAGQGTLGILDLHTEERSRLIAHPGGIAHLKAARDRDLVISCGRTNQVRVWDLASAACLHTLTLPAPVLEAALSPDGTHALTVTDARQLLLWDLGTGTSRTFALSARPLRGWSLSVDHRYATGMATDAVRLFDLSADRRPRLLDGRVGRPRPAVFSPDGVHLAFCCEHGPGRVFVWNIPAREAFVLEAGNAVHSDLAFSPDGGRLAVSAPVVAPDGGLSVWDLATRRATRYPQTASRLCFADDGQRLFWADRSQVGVLDLTTGATSVLGEIEAVSTLAMSCSPEGRRVVVASVLPSQATVFEDDGASQPQVAGGGLRAQCSR